MKEVRAIVLGVMVVLLAALGLAWWHRPASEFTRIKEFRVEVRNKQGDSTRRLSFTIPTSLIARAAKLAHLDSIGGDIKADWGKGDVSVQDILDAAEKSAPGKPGVIEKGDSTIEVVADGDALEIDVKDGWDKHVHIRLPRGILEGLSDERTISTSEILRRLDELDPGDVVTIKDSENEVTITAVPRKGRGIHIS
jgi:hypothetical protein